MLPGASAGDHDLDPDHLPGAVGDEMGLEPSGRQESRQVLATVRMEKICDRELTEGDRIATDDLAEAHAVEEEPAARVGLVRHQRSCTGSR